MNQISAEAGSFPGVESGDGDRAVRRFVLLTRLLTASESSSPSSDEAEPDKESSKPGLTLSIEKTVCQVNIYHQVAERKFLQILSVRR